MSELAYYNEHEPYAAAWLRNLIAAGHIAPGDVDERSILDVRPSDLDGYAQCHFFAGIGVWSYALRLAGWPDERPVWTGSPPCQPLSSAGLRRGHADERHLWPALHGLIAERRPAAFLGEQVASQDGREWFAAVRADLEHLGYACGAADLAAAGVSAPHIRQRLFFVADAGGDRSHPRCRHDGEMRGIPEAERQSEHSSTLPRRGRAARVVADAAGERPQGRGPRGRSRPGHEGAAAERGGAACGLGNTDAAGRNRRAKRDERAQAGQHAPLGADALRSGPWATADWLPCRDGKARPVEPIAQSLADGSTESLGPVRSDIVAAIAEEILSHACACKAEPGEALHDLWRALATEAICERSGRLRGVHEAPVLLAFLRQLADEGWALAQSFPRAGSEASAGFVRSLRGNDPASGAPCRRGLAEQRPVQHPDLVRVLSSVLARHAQAAWGEAFDAHAARTFPLAHGVPSRVGRLRAYGNAIVAPLAAEFIGAYLDCGG